MNNIFNIKTPAEKQAEAIRSDYGLENLGLKNQRKVYWNLPPEALYEEIIFRSEGRISHSGPVIVETGEHTARAANDKYVVREPSTEENIWWSEYNRPFSPEQFDELFSRLQGYLQGRDIFVQDCYAGADEEYRLPVRIITEHAWHSLFAYNMFIQPQKTEDYRRHAPDFTVIAAPDFKAFPQIDQTNSGTFIVLNFAQKIAIIGNSGYGGEIKKSVFTVMNYLLPLQGVMAMHCSANQGKDGSTALFFGLSGTGKTTLSADPARGLIGDDEHGWSDNGIFNFEGGCYAKVIELSPSAEPQIHACTQRFGSVLENVVYDPVTRLIDLDDPTLTVNTRVSYPIEYIGNAVVEKRGGHPKNVILLTCDASGVMPPIARLSLEQAMYHFISGYTSKVGGTELGLREEPEITFSACFGAPFMVHHPYFYADLLKRKIEYHGANCWLVNTGWVGGPYGIGKRISIRHTRAMLNAALDGKLDDVEFIADPVFGFSVPKVCPDVPDDVLDPSSSWPDAKEYDKKYHQLAARFVDNFKKFAPDCPPELVEAGPRI
ncbi:MAG: phosphoenolpyruvate carboxykinase (ATP) [Anaerolineaceae bacterium 4572_5.1]|nr:MAG: phosphoenolpyruvate carboxykinase (ATP) [Anaerolineaceae bacterium 4572_5.1]